MKRVILYVLLGGIFLSFCAAQSEYTIPKVVKEYPATGEVNRIFDIPKADPYADYGVGLAGDMEGRLYLLDYDKNIIHVLNDSDFIVCQSFNVNPFPIWGHCSGDKNGFYYVSSSGYFEYISFEGNVKFYGDLSDVFNFTPRMDISSSFYHAGVLFFLDQDNKIHSIINPGMDETQNRANYRNPEQTKKLFEKDSGVDLKGLTLDSRGLYFLNGVFLGPPFLPIIGKWCYTLNTTGAEVNSFGIGDLSESIYFRNLDNSNTNENAEGYAVHPSGDIFILKYDNIKKSHVLSRIENTWDVEIRNTWYAKAAERAANEKKR